MKKSNFFSIYLLLVCVFGIFIWLCKEKEEEIFDVVVEEERFYDISFNEEVNMVLVNSFIDVIIINKLDVLKSLVIDDYMFCGFFVKDFVNVD